MVELKDDGYKTEDVWTDDQHTAAKRLLNDVLSFKQPDLTRTPLTPPVPETASAPPVPPTAAEVDEPILQEVSVREHSRVIFVTEDKRVLDPESASSRFYHMISSAFDEVHVLVVMQGSKKTYAPKRLGDRVWVYGVSDTTAGLRTAVTEYLSENLEFGGVFRPDIVVGIDPLVAGEVAYDLATIHDVPAQLHVSSHWWKKQINGTYALPWMKRRHAWKLLKRYQSIRTTEGSVAEYIAKRCKSKDVATLPTYHGVSQMKHATPSFDVHEKYPDFKFVMVSVAPLTAESSLHDVFTVARPVLLKNRIGLLVIGTGPMKEHFVERAKLLGIEKNVVFLGGDVDLVSVFKTADLLIDLRVGEVTDALTLESVAANLPLLGYTTKLREDLLHNKESAYLIEPNALDVATENLRTFLNNQGTRISFKSRLEMIAETRIESTEETYLTAFAQSVESVLGSQQ